jgi:hypothetical protein
VNAQNTSQQASTPKAADRNSTRGQRAKAMATLTADKSKFTVMIHPLD